MTGFTGPRAFGAAVLFPGLTYDQLSVLQASLTSGWVKQRVLGSHPVRKDTAGLLEDCSTAIRQRMADGDYGDAL